MSREGLLEALAAQAPAHIVKDDSASAASGKFILQEWIATFCTDAKEPKETSTGRVWELKECPWNTEHKGSAFIKQWKDGTIVAGCHHNSCRDKGWHDLRDANEPGWRERQRPKSSGAIASKKRRLTQVGTFQPFPVEVLPGIVRTYITDAARAICCDTAMIALPLLASIAAAIGNARRIVLKPSWREPSVLWCGIVADSGRQKSPAIDKGTDFYRRREADAIARYRREMSEFQRDMQLYEADYGEWKRKGRRNGEPAPSKPEEPQPQRYVIDDVTVEALADRLQYAPRGLLVVRDELAGWLAGFNQYKRGRGGDEAAWLAMHGARPLTVDRKSGTQKIIYVPRAAVNIAGGIQPGVLRRLLAQEHFESGLAARLLLSMPPAPVRFWSAATISNSTIEALDYTFERLLALDFAEDDEGRPKPIDVPLSRDGTDAWAAFYNAHAAEQLELMGDLAAAWSKLECYAARFALIIHWLRWATDETGLINKNTIDGQSVEAGVRLVRWFGHEARRVYGILSDDPDTAEQRQLIELIERKGGRITPAELRRACRRYRDSVEDAEKALAELISADMGRWETNVPATGGRPPQTFVLVSDRTPSLVTETPVKPEEMEGFGDSDNSDIEKLNSLLAEVEPDYADGEGSVEWTS